MSVHHDMAGLDATSHKPATAEQLARLEAALLTLPRFTRAVFFAHRIDDLSYVEIAHRTGVSVRRIEREITRAICVLCRAMEPKP